MAQHALNIVSVTDSSDMEKYIPMLAKLRMEVFREYPYLYDGDLDYEHNYLQTYIDSPQSIIVIAHDGDHMVGASTGVPLAHESAELKQPFIDNGYNVEEIFYCAESVMLKSYRGRGMGNNFFDRREGHALKLGGFCYSCFCRVERPDDHPGKPENYKPLDDFWQRRGYREYPELRTTFSWKEVDEEESTPKPMVFWMKELTPVG